jgi:hypothetical protein
MMTKQISRRDWERLSAYLDHQLTVKENAGLVARLDSDKALQAALKELQMTRKALSQLPYLQAPRNFTLTPEMVGVQKSQPSRWYPAFRFASVMISLLFVVVIVGDFIGVRTVLPKQQMAAPEMAPAAEIAVQESVDYETVSDDELPLPKAETEAEVMISESELDAVVESVSADEASGDASAEPVAGMDEPPLAAEETEIQERDISITEPAMAEAPTLFEQSETQESEIPHTEPAIAEAPALIDKSGTQENEVYPAAPAEPLSGGEPLMDNANRHLESEGISPTNEPPENLWLPILEIVLGGLAVGTSIIAFYLRQREL